MKEARQCPHKQGPGITSPGGVWGEAPGKIFRFLTIFDNLRTILRQKFKKYEGNNAPTSRVRRLQALVGCGAKPLEKYSDFCQFLQS